jgi:hypothetical protein
MLAAALSPCEWGVIRRLYGGVPREIGNNSVKPRELDYYRLIEDTVSPLMAPFNPPIDVSLP